MSRLKVFGMSLLLAVAQAHASSMAELDDSEMSSVSGEGLAFALKDFRFQAASTSYIEQIGTPGGSGGFLRGDLRWYGLSITGAQTVGATHWDGTACTVLGTEPLSCPLGGTVGYVASYDNPYVIRAFNYTKQTVDTATNGTVGSAAVSRTVLELLSPSNSDIYRWAFWGEAEAGKGLTADGGNNDPGFLQNQVIIIGKPSAPNQDVVAAAGCTASGCTPSNATVATSGTPRYGSVLQMFQVANSADPTMGLIYHNRLSGDFRFTLAQDAAGPGGTLGVPARFSTREGVFFKNVAAYLPMGQMHYQSLILDDVASAPGNFIMELTRVPTNATKTDSDAYNDFYSLSGTCGAVPYTGTNCGYQRAGRPGRYFETHGYVYYGVLGTPNDDIGGTTAVRTADITDGIFFRGVATFNAFADRVSDLNSDIDDNLPISRQFAYTYATGASPNFDVNIGDAYIEGMLIQHLKITSCGAGATSPC